MSKISHQLTSAHNYDTGRMIFSEPQIGTVPNTVPAINYRRIPISTRNADGTVGDLIIPTERLFSFGVSENTNPETKAVNGYVLPLCLWNKDGPSEAEKEWSDTFDAIVEQCKEHLVENREEIEQYDLTLNDLKKFNPLYWKKDKTNPDKKKRGNILPGSGPTLYAKLIATKKLEIRSMFFDTNNEQLNPMDLLGKFCHSKAAVKIESIFIGNKISLQVKLYEAVIEESSSGMKPLLARPKASSVVLMGTSTTMNDTAEPEPVDNDDCGSIGSGSDHEEEAPKPKPVRKIRRVKKTTE